MRQRNDRSWRADTAVHLPLRGRLRATGPVDWIGHYDQLARGALFRRRLRWAASLMPEGMGRVLEVGFGSGIFQYELVRRADLSVGLDIHPHAAQVRRTLGEDGIEASLVCGDGAFLPFRAKAFDAVVILSSLEFMADPTLCLQECRRVLRSGGHLVCVRPRQLRWADRVFRLLMGVDPESQFAGGRERAEAAVRQTMQDAEHYFRPAHLPAFLAPYEVLRLDVS